MRGAPFSGAHTLRSARERDKGPRPIRSAAFPSLPGVGFRAISEQPDHGFAHFRLAIQRRSLQELGPCSWDGSKINADRIGTSWQALRPTGQNHWSCRNAHKKRHPPPGQIPSSGEIGRLWRPALVILGFWLGTNLEAASVTASLNRETTTVGESVELSLEFEGVSGQPSPLPSIPNLVIVPRSPINTTTIINGRYSSSLVFPYSVTPQQPGDYTIPCLHFQVGDQVISTAPLKLKVLKGDLSRFAFLRMLVPKTNLFIGEVLPVDIQLFVAQSRARNIQVPQFQADGFLLGKFVIPDRDNTNGLVTQTSTNGQVYQVFHL